MEPKGKRRALENGDVSYHHRAKHFRPTTTRRSPEKSTVYLDCNATTPLETSVLDAIYSTLKYAWGNPSSCYAEGKMAKRVIDESRKHVSKMINTTPNDVIFTSGGTEANNMVFHSVVNRFKDNFPPTMNSSSILQCQDVKENGVPTTALPHIITTNIEHDSVILPLKLLQEQGKIELTVLPVSKETGQVEVDDIKLSLKWNTGLVSVMLANNETGVIQPVKEISKAVRMANILRIDKDLSPVLIHTDAAQAIGKINVDCEELGVDYLTIVGHKFYGPRTGGLFARNLGNADGAPVLPIFYGGGQERNYRPGTENTGMIAGLGEACRLVAENLETYDKHMEEIRDYLESRLEVEFRDQIRFNSRFIDSKRLPNTCNVSFLGGPNLRGHKIIAAAKCLQASVGAACHSDQGDRPSHILLSCGIPEDVASNAIRLSVGRYTSRDDIDSVIDDLKCVVNELGSVS